MDSLRKHLTFLYGEARAADLLKRTEQLLAEYRPRIQPHNGELTERDSILITYGDQIQSAGEKPLQTLKRFCDEHLAALVRGIHILPFYPWTSDDGFSVTDYRQVDGQLGAWADVSALATHFKLMFDAVINHISAESLWFQKFLQGDSQYQNYFITVEGEPNLAQVVRPRALPLLTAFGEQKIWTTFSADQIDLNYQNPQVLLEILDVLLRYVQHGATLIRLDAIAYLWKALGTPCIHLPQTHAVIQFFRAALNQIAPHVQLITETNVPHVDNLSYFGDGYSEAQLVYNFALPPLTLHAFQTGSATTLSNWAQTLTLPSEQTTFFNFLASHDGIGLNPARGILTDAEVEALARQTLAHGGLISYKNNSDGTQSPYEMNINYFDALSNPNGNEALDVQISRFICAQAIMLSMIGVPGIYFHSLFGSRGWLDGVKQTGRNRTINREKLQWDTLQAELANPDSLRSKVFARYRQLLQARRSAPAFHPHGSQKVLELHPAVFAVQRMEPHGQMQALCLHNVSSSKVVFSTEYASGVDLFSGAALTLSQVTLEPYQVRWALVKI
ncbi:MAG: sugar phosphorylase [Anaerolineales bacterium]|nr:sugar phosphorylase [Anaerolineales bacterium]